MHDPLVIAVILNNNRKKDTLECLESLMGNSYSKKKIIVLDNNSTDGSILAIWQAYPSVQIIDLDENLGYAGNNNIGIRTAMDRGAEWIFILNDDTVLGRECLQELVEAGEQDPDIGILGPLVYHYSEPHVIQSAGGLLGKGWESIHLGKNELDRGQYFEPRPVKWISGCAILVRRAAIQQVGMLDTNYFMYWEDTEWSLRIARAGWKIINVPRAKIWHKGVQRDYEPKPSFIYYGTRNHLLTLAKHQAPLGAKIYTWSQILRTLLSWSVKPKWRIRRAHRDAMWAGILDYLRHRWGAMPS